MFRAPKRIFNTSSPKFEWTAPTFMMFECTLDNERFRNCGQGQTGEWTGNNVPDGLHNFKVRATDGDGNVVEAEIRGWIVDTIPPVLTFTNAAEKTNDSPVLTWRSSEQAKFECKLDDRPYENCGEGINGRWSKNNVPHGRHRLSVRGRDSAGNLGTTSYTWFVGKKLNSVI